MGPGVTLNMQSSLQEFSLIFLLLDPAVSRSELMEVAGSSRHPVPTRCASLCPRSRRARRGGSQSWAGDSLGTRDGGLGPWGPVSSSGVSGPKG